MNIKYSYIDAVRGDDCFIPVIAEVSGTTRIHLRQNTESINYYILEIVDNNVFIPASITVNLEGHYEFDIETTIDSVTTTVQHTDIDFIPDVTRLYGDVKQVDNSDFERLKVIGEDFYIRNADNSLTSLKPFRYNQNTPSAVWNIQHNLNKRPSVTIIDTAGTVIEGSIKYEDTNNITVTFNAAFSGFAECN